MDDWTDLIAAAAREYVRAVTDPALRQVTCDSLRAWSEANSREIAARQSLIAAVDAETQPGLHPQPDAASVEGQPDLGGMALS